MGHLMRMHSSPFRSCTSRLTAIPKIVSGVPSSAISCSILFESLDCDVEDDDPELELEGPECEHDEVCSSWFSDVTVRSVIGKGSASS